MIEKVEKMNELLQNIDVSPKNVCQKQEFTYEKWSSSDEASIDSGIDSPTE